jgi:hypothetical protein
MGAIRRSRMLVPIAILLCALPAGAQSLDVPPPPLRLVLTAFGAFRANPLGFGLESHLSLRQRLYASESPALADNFASLGIDGAVSPASAHVGVAAELQPLTVIGFYARAGVTGYFGNFDELQAFPSPRSDWSNAAIDSIAALPPGDPRHSQAASSFELAFGSRQQVKLGQIALSNEASMTRYSASLREGDRVFYEPTQAVIVGQKAYLFTDDLDLVWLHGGLVAGLRFSVLHPFFGARHYAPGEPLENDDSEMRLGPLLAYRFFKNDGHWFNAPTLVLLTNWYLQHRYRTGAEISQAIPYVVVGFGFFGDLMGLDRI